MNKDNEGGAMSEGRWAEALSWYVTLREGKKKDLSGDVGRRWAHWHGDPENQRIFDDVSRLLAERGFYRIRLRCSKAGLEEDRYDLSVPIAEWRKSQALREIGERRSSGRNRWWWFCGGLSLATATAVLIVLRPLQFGPGGGYPSSTPVVYQTDIGGLRTVQLPDGSRIVLGGQTKLSVAFSAPHRSVTLVAGQAWFQVVHNTRWPFVVTVGGSTITDIGTAFVVTLDSDRVFVTVTEGTVAVTRRARRPGAVERNHSPDLTSSLPVAPFHVARGEELSLGDDGMVGVVRPTDTHAAIAWFHGRQVFYDMPLRYVVEAVDRYSSRRIVVEPSAGLLRFGGVVYNDEIEDWLKSLETIFPVTVKDQDGNVRIEMRQSTTVARRLRSRR